MKIQYLGTAAAEGWPGIFCNCPVCREAVRRGGKNIRSRSQALVDDSLLIDFPPDSYYHMIQYHVPMAAVQNILLTHAHQDHFYPLDLTMRGNGFSDEVTGILQIYGNELCCEWFGEAVRTASPYMELDRRLAFHTITKFQTLNLQGYTITPLPALHDRRQNCLIYLLKKDGKKLLYGNDTGWFPDETWRFLEREGHLDGVSLDCTMGRQKEGTNHMGIPDNREVIKRLKLYGCVDSDTKIVITHFYHHGGVLHEELEQEVGTDGWYVAYDGFCLEI